VIYRDSGSKSGEVETPLAEFTSQTEDIDVAIERLQPEDGAPFFNELMDLGIHEAITTLPWSEDRNVSKWILLFGDAPPYEVSFNDKSLPRSKRLFTDELLVSLAARRGIQIHCVLCSSTDETKESYQASIRQTRRVMDRLSSQTGGMVLDLSYPVIREALAGTSQSNDVDYTEIQPITQSDLRRRQNESPATQRPVTIAVLPHEPIDQMAFGSDRPAMQVVTALNHQLRSVPGVRVKNVLDVEKQVRRMRAEGLSDREAIRGLAARLRVDYVVWGRLQDQPAITSVAFRRRDGIPIFKVDYDGSPDGLSNKIFVAAAASGNTDAEFSNFAKRILQNADQAKSLAALSSNPKIVTNLLTAMGALEQVLGLPVGDSESDRLLAQGKAAAAAVLQDEPANPTANWLLANLTFNQASAAYQRGEAEIAKSNMKVCKNSLRLAFDRKSDVQSLPLRREIEADYLLIARSRFDEAIRIYEMMTDRAMPEDTQARGHWMLSGLYAGDWGMNASMVDPERSRKHLVALLADWPDRPEAEQLRRWLRWDEQTQTTQHHFLPQLNDVLVGLE
jgi:hypothetical protein